MEGLMCGIAGIFDRTGASVSAEVAAAMAAVLAHRGPDDVGLWSAVAVAFSHRRLAIRDLGPSGHQPISDPSGRITITYNGEIYNDAALRRELARDFGCTFRGNCDAETIPLAYRHWGQAAFARLEGMFAIALWDAALEKLFLVRDGVGIKPLFYSDDGRTVRFASEIKGLLADPGQPRRIAAADLHRYFAMGYAGPEATTLEGIHQVAPGTVLTFDAGGRSARAFWRPRRGMPAMTTREEALRHFLPLWERVVDELMISDVPVGVLQSGGIDSSLITLTVARRHKPPLFTAAFAEESHDECPLARQVAALTGLEHHVVAVAGQAEASATLAQVVHHFDGQVCDESALPLFTLLAAVRGHVKVVLSGDGGDEFFGGYPTYDASRIAALLGWLVPARAASLLGRAAYSAQAGNERRQPGLALLARFALGIADGPGHAHARWRRLIHSFQLAELYGPFLAAVAEANPFQDYERELEDDALPLVDRCLLADQRYHLPAGLLMKADAMSMAHSLELRVPLLDRRIMDFSANCHANLLAPPLAAKKRLLRDALHRYHAPRAVVGGRKRGFNSPIARLLRTSLRRLGEVLFVAEADRLAPYLQPAAVRRLWIAHLERRANHAYALWPILTFAIWLQQMEQSAARGKTRAATG
jgi:asparagine synthase (glutamine-hydrolysing)